MKTIEQLWQELRSAGSLPRQRRVDADHPHDLYADFAPPDEVALLAICSSPPPAVRPTRAVSVDVGRRNDGRWSLRLALSEPRLIPVFGALCRDIVNATRKGVGDIQLAKAILDRLDRWRSLLDRGGSGLGECRLRGLIGELLFLDLHLMHELPAPAAVACWIGPGGSPQDFLLPTGLRIEVKTVGENATTARINGIEQLDSRSDPLDLAVVRVVTTGRDVPGAVTAPALIQRIRARLEDDSDALLAFENALGCLGWHDDPSHELLAVRPVAVEMHHVGPDFPRLVRGSIPAGVEDADYTIALPPGADVVWETQQ